LHSVISLKDQALTQQVLPWIAARQGFYTRKKSDFCHKIGWLSSIGLVLRSHGNLAESQAKPRAETGDPALQFLRYRLLASGQVIEYQQTIPMV
jgi:hypothetical protein